MAQIGDPTTLNRLYGRGKGHNLRKGQQALVDDLLPGLAVPDGALDAKPNKRRCTRITALSVPSLF
jgi:hypothetical protein